jgi:hypothetical protein
MSMRLRSYAFFALLVWLALSTANRYGIQEAREEAADFPSYYYGAKLSFQLGISPYNSANWKIAENLYTNGYLYPFIYPPPGLLVFWILPRLDYETSKLATLALNHILALFAVYLLFFKICRLKTTDWLPWVGVLYFYNFYPLLYTLTAGQINLVILVSICLTWIGIKDKWHPAWTAIPLALGIILKIYPLLFFILLIFRREYKTIFYTLLILGLLSLVASTALPGGIWQDWIENVASRGYLKDINGLGIGRPGNQSINALLIRTFYGLNVRFDPLITPPEWVIRISPYVICGAIGLLSLLATWLTRKLQSSLEIHFSIWLLAIFLIAPISWDHHLVLILPAIFIALLQAIHYKWHGWMFLLGAVACFLALNVDFNHPAFREGWLTLFISSKLYAVTVFWIFFMVLSIKMVKASGSTHLGRVS